MNSLNGSVYSLAIKCISCVFHGIFFVIPNFISSMFMNKMC